jgi:hypothetical protein
MISAIYYNKYESKNELKKIKIHKIVNKDEDDCNLLNKIMYIDNGTIIDCDKMMRTYDIYELQKITECIRNKKKSTQQNSFMTKLKIINNKIYCTFIRTYNLS